MKPAVGVLVLALGLAALAGCGGASADLLAVQRAGAGPGAALRLVVNDGGTVTCNGGAARRMPDPLLLDARELQRQLEKPAKADLTLRPGAQSVLRYDVRTPDGRVRFADDSAGRPPALDQLVLLVRRLSLDVCGLQR